MFILPSVVVFVARSCCLNAEALGFGNSGVHRVGYGCAENQRCLVPIFACALTEIGAVVK